MDCDAADSRTSTYDLYEKARATSLRRTVGAGGLETAKFSGRGRWPACKIPRRPSRRRPLPSGRPSAICWRSSGPSCGNARVIDLTAEEPRVPTPSSTPTSRRSSGSPRHWSHDRRMDVRAPDWWHDVRPYHGGRFTGDGDELVNQLTTDESY